MRLNRTAQHAAPSAVSVAARGMIFIVFMVFSLNGKWLREKRLLFSSLREGGPVITPHYLETRTIQNAYTIANKLNQNLTQSRRDAKMTDAGTQNFPYCRMSEVRKK